MDTATVLGLLRERFGDELRATREAGRQTMVETVAARTGATADEALAWIDRLEADGYLTFDAAALTPPAMLEAARYGDIPTGGADQGVWRIQL